jgi:hypothetical protein
LAGGALVATAGASPFIESFTLSGELVASLVAALAVLALWRHLESGRPGWLVAAGLLAGAAVMVKQSAFDAALVAGVVVARRAPRSLAVLAASVAAPVAVAALGSGDVSAWWQAVVGYGAHASLGSHDRLGLFWSSAPAAAKALAPVAVLAAVGLRAAPGLFRLWVGAAALGVLAGGNFHAHYYVQLVVPLSCVAAFSLTALPDRAGALALGAAATASVAFAVPLWTATDDAQARSIWPRDPHLRTDRAVAAYVRAHSAPRRPIYVLWAAADLYYLTDRAPAFRYLWLRNLQTVRGAVAGVRGMLTAGRPSLVVVVEPPRVADESGATAAIIARDYRLVARIGETRIYRPRSGP